MQAKCMLYKRIMRNLVGWSLCSFAWISSVGAQKAADQVEVVPLLSAAEQAAADEFLANMRKTPSGSTCGKTGGTCATNLSAAM